MWEIQMLLYFFLTVVFRAVCLKVRCWNLRHFFGCSMLKEMIAWARGRKEWGDLGDRLEQLEQRVCITYKFRVMKLWITTRSKSKLQVHKANQNTQKLQSCNCLSGGKTSLMCGWENKNNSDTEKATNAKPNHVYYEYI